MPQLPVHCRSVPIDYNREGAELQRSVSVHGKDRRTKRSNLQYFKALFTRPQCSSAPVPQICGMGADPSILNGDVMDAESTHCALRIRICGARRRSSGWRLRNNIEHVLFLPAIADKYRHLYGAGGKVCSGSATHYVHVNKA